MGQDIYGKTDKEEVKILRVLFADLYIAFYKGIIDDKTYQQLRRRLVDGSLTRQEADFLQDRRRLAVDKWLRGETLSLDDI